MERLLFHKVRVKNITDQQWSRLSTLFGESRRWFTPTDIGNEASIDYMVALALVIAMASDRVAENHYLIYHMCNAAPIAKRKFVDGLQPIPWQCPYCEEVITDPDDLRYEVSCKPSGLIEFV
jgi:hypothetical protein